MMQTKQSIIDAIAGYGSCESEIDGYTVKIEPDSDPESPREWSNLGTMVCWHRRYNLGDEQPSESPSEYYESTIKPAGGVALPLYLYDHFGLRMSTGGFSDPWDSGQVGYIYVTAEKIREEYSVKRITKAVRERATACLRGEVETYSQFLEGDVYGYTIERDGEHIDSCWGFYGSKYVREGVADALLCELNRAHKARLEKVKTWIRNRVPLEARTSV